MSSSRRRTAVPTSVTPSVGDKREHPCPATGRRNHPLRLFPRDAGLGDQRRGLGEAPAARRADERPAARRPLGRQRTLAARPVADSAEFGPDPTFAPQVIPSERARMGCLSDERRRRGSALTAARRGSRRPTLSLRTYLPTTPDSRRASSPIDNPHGGARSTRSRIR